MSATNKIILFERLYDLIILDTLSAVVFNSINNEKNQPLIFFLRKNITI